MGKKYIIAVNEDGTDHCLTVKETWDSSGDESMKVAEEFEAATFEEAKIIYEAWKDELQQKLDS